MTLGEELSLRTSQAYEAALSSLRAHAAEVVEDGGKKRPRFSPRTTEAMASFMALMFKMEYVWGEDPLAGGKASEVTMDYFMAAVEAFGLREHFADEYLWYRVRLNDDCVRELTKQFEQVA